jgi:hypothetical protein
MVFFIDPWVPFALRSSPSRWPLRPPRNPSAVAVDRAGNVYVADTTSHTIRKISGGSVSTLAGLAGEWGGRDGVGPKPEIGV